MLSPHFLTAIVLAAVPHALPTEEELLHKAEAAYRQGAAAYGTARPARQYFATAADRYAKLVRNGVNNPALFADLGQSYLLAGDLPRAILAYRNGLRLDPNNRTLQERLEDARNQVLYTTPGSFARPPVDNWPPWFPRLTLRWRLILVLVLFWAACLGLTRWAMTRNGGYLALTIPSLVLAGFLGAGLFLTAQERSWEKTHPAVVIAGTEVVLHKGNGANYPCYDAENRTWLETGGSLPAAASRLPVGAEAQVRFDRGDWLQIELAGGEIGWVRRSDVVLDPPW